MTTLDAWRARRCSSDQANLPKLDAEVVRGHLAAFPDWRVSQRGWLHRNYDFERFMDAARMVVDVAELACDENHHPDVKLGYVGKGRGRISIDIWTHKQGALTDNDFILAAKIEHLIARSTRPADRERAP